jgi:hypothetical protein
MQSGNCVLKFCKMAAVFTALSGKGGWNSHHLVLAKVHLPCKKGTRWHSSPWVVWGKVSI